MYPRCQKTIRLSPVRVIEPFGAGGGPDLLARALAQQLSELWGQPVTVENIPGAGATAGPAQVAKSLADGYTLLMNTSAQAYSAALSKNLPYDPLKDFIPITPLTSQPYVLVAGKSAGITTVGELVAAAKAKPGKLQVWLHRNRHRHALRDREIQSRGGHQGCARACPDRSDAIADVIAQQHRWVHHLHDGAHSALALPRYSRKADLLRLGVTSARRSSLLPEVPTIAEAASPDSTSRFGMGYGLRLALRAGVVDKLVGGHWTRAGRCIGSARLDCQARRRADEYDAARVRALRAERE